MLSEWIIDRFPEHECYVEVFGGSAAVLANKPKSKVEVYNDLDGDLIHFFETLRDRGDELVEWLRNTPHSRELNKKYSEEFYSGERATDDVERAGKFWYLRETSFAGKYVTTPGYNGSAGANPARTMRNKREKLREFSSRFGAVQIENLDFEALIERYGGDDTLLYLDPPYMDEGDDLYSHEGGFNHGRLCDVLAQTESDWIVSYTRIPEPLREMAVVIDSQDRRVRMRQGQGDWEKTNTENLVMNYDPEERATFSGAGQTTLDV